MAHRIHVVAHGREWGIYREGARSFLDTYATQGEAIDAAGRWARLNNAEILIHLDAALEPGALALLN